MKSALNRLAGKRAVITGAASGIGRATALLFAREGAAVACVDVDETLGRETVEMICREGGSAEFFAADLRVPDAIRSMASACMAWSEKIDVLFNNAGILVRQSFEEVALENWMEQLAVNLTAPFLCSQLFLPALKAAGTASIIHNGSIDSVLGNPTIAAYSASKGGLVPLTHVMAHALGPYGIRVNCINSGAISTSDQGIPIRLTPETRRGAAMSDFQRTATPLGRPGKVEELAAVALFLASDEASYMSGSIITMDGGRTGITQGTAG